MRIVYVSPRHPYSIGGVEYTVQKLAEGMVARGHQVSVICGTSAIKKSTIEEINGIKVLNIPTCSPKGSFHLPKDKRLIENYLTNDVDIVHAHSAHAIISTIPLNLKKSTTTKWRLVYTLHFSTPGYSLFKRLLWKLFWKRRINSRLKYVDAIHSTSEVESHLIKDTFSSANGKTTLIPLGMDDDVFGYCWKGIESDYIIYCGRLEKYKRIELTVKSVELVRKQGYDVDFVIVGKGSRAAYLDKLAKDHKWITCMRPKPRQEYLKLLSNARAAVNLSSAENFNLFLAEACVMGVPIVATPNAAAFCPQFANVHKLEPNTIAATIVNALLRPKSCIFPETCTPSSWNEIVEQFEKFYTNLLDKQTKPTLRAI